MRASSLLGTSEINPGRIGLPGNQVDDRSIQEAAAYATIELLRGINPVSGASYISGNN